MKNHLHARRESGGQNVNIGAICKPLTLLLSGIIASVKDTVMAHHIAIPGQSLYCRNPLFRTG